MGKAPRYNRRIASILSADVVGYSRLVSQNDEMTVRALSSCRKIIHRIVAKHNSRVFGSAGDSFMIECTDPIWAVECAVEIQAALRQRNNGIPEAQQMWLRVGVNLGEVIEDDGVLHGESINVAVRLQEACPSGGVVVSELIHSRVSGSIDLEFRSLGQLVFKHIPRPIQVFEVVTKNQYVPEIAPALSIIDIGEPIAGFGGRSAVAVLPFDNETNDPNCGYLSDGFSEDLVTGLSHLRWFPIIARNSSFAFRGTLTDLKKIGKLLGARYLVDGSLGVAGDGLRITARLVASEDARILWSSRYDVQLTQLLTTLDEVAACIVGTLQGRIEEAEQVRARGRRRSRLDTWGLIWRGRWHLNRLTRADAEEARRLFDDAVENDPLSAEALIHLAWWTYFDVWTQRRSQDQLEISLRER